VGRTIGELDLRRRFGVSVAGVWERGTLQVAEPELTVEESSILLLVGTRTAIDAYDAAQVDESDGEQAAAPGLVVILGGGRVGRAAAGALGAAGTPYRVVELREERVRHLDDVVIGDAADREVLRQAGIDEAAAVVITTHDDDANIYLTLYCRRLRPDIEILGRVKDDRNLSTMHRAGADMVLSYASTGAMEAWNALRGGSTLLLAEGLVMFRVPVPMVLAGKQLGRTQLREQTGCTVVGVAEDDTCRTELDATTVLPHDADLILVGDTAAEERFLERYVAEEGATLAERLARLRRRVRRD
ncbi:MAG: NAD-binding protein, partial [Actinomycetota bacterium]